MQCHNRDITRMWRTKATESIRIGAVTIRSIGSLSAAAELVY